MSGDEQLWRIGKECRSHAGIVVSRITADMFDEYIDILALKTVQLMIHQSQVAPVAVAADSTERTERSKSVGYFRRPDVTGMPYLVAGFEVVQVLIIPERMRVTQYSYSLHITP